MKTSRTPALHLGLLYLCFFGHLPCVSALVTAAGAGASRAAPLMPDYVEGEVLVQFRAAETWDSAQFTATLHGLELARRFDWLSVNQGQVMCLLRSPMQTTADLIAELSQDPTVALVEPNYLRWSTDMRTPNDPRFGQLWGLQRRLCEWLGLWGVPSGVANLAELIFEIFKDHTALHGGLHVFDVDADDLVHG